MPNSFGSAGGINQHRGSRCSIADDIDTTPEARKRSDMAEAFFRKRNKYAFEREWRIIRAHRLEDVFSGPITSDPSYRLAALYGSK
jgi:hypothetical protein